MIYHDWARAQRELGRVAVWLPGCEPGRCFCVERMPRSARLGVRAEDGTRGAVVSVTATHVEIAMTGRGTVAGDRAYRTLAEIAWLGERTGSEWRELETPESPYDLLPHKPDVPGWQAGGV